MNLLDFSSAEFPQFTPKNPYEEAVKTFLQDWMSPSETVSVQTSGSTGTPKIFHIEKKRMRASAAMTCAFLGLRQGHTALLCLPVEYISGKMMIVRALESKMRLYIGNPNSQPLKDLDCPIDFCAVTPLQAEHAPENLKYFRKVIIGGAAVADRLKRKMGTALRSSGANTQIYETYGMSETLSHIALKEIFPGEEDAFSALPGIKLSLDNRNCLRIEAPHLNENTVETNDIVQLVGEDKFRFLGRADHVINSAGLKIHPEELEALLLKIILREVVIAPLADEILGQKVIAVIEGAETPELRKNIDEADFPSKNHRPKEVIFLEKLPRLPNGKIDRLAIARWLEHLPRS